VQTEALQAKRNTLAKKIGQLRASGSDATAEMAESKQIPASLSELEQQLAALQNELKELLSTVPNLPHESVPQGENSEDNVEVRRWVPGKTTDSGDPAPLDFECLDHVAVG